jgi:hypothetical protein
MVRREAQMLKDGWDIARQEISQGETGEERRFATGSVTNYHKFPEL